MAAFARGRGLEAPGKRGSLATSNFNPYAKPAAATVCTTAPPARKFSGRSSTTLRVAAVSSMSATNVPASMRIRYGPSEDLAKFLPRLLGKIGRPAAHAADQVRCEVEQLGVERAHRVGEEVGEHDGPILARYSQGRSIVRITLLPAFPKRTPKGIRRL